MTTLTGRYKLRFANLILQYYFYVLFYCTEHLLVHHATEFVYPVKGHLIYNILFWSVNLVYRILEDSRVWGNKAIHRLKMEENIKEQKIIEAS